MEEPSAKEIQSEFKYSTFLFYDYLKQFIIEVKNFSEDQKNLVEKLELDLHLKCLTFFKPEKLKEVVLPNLKTLIINLNNSGIENDLMSFIAENICSSSFLQNISIDFSLNVDINSGLESILKALKEKSNLNGINLNLDSTGIGSEQVTYLEEVIKKNNLINNLVIHLSNNYIGNDSIVSFIKSIENLSELIKLELYFDLQFSFDEEKWKIFEINLEKLKNLKSLIFVVHYSSDVQEGGDGTVTIKLEKSSKKTQSDSCKIECDEEHNRFKMIQLISVFPKELCVTINHRQNKSVTVELFEFKEIKSH
jgi:hypothetical protein